MFSLFRRKRKPYVEWVIPDLLDLHQAYEGVFILGGIGSGKTSGPGAALAEGLYMLGCGICVCVVKPDERARWERLVKNPIIYGPGQGCFDFITYELNQPGGSIESVAQLLDMLVSLGERGKDSEPFWRLYSEKVFRRALAAVYYGTGKCSIADLYFFITSAPGSLAQLSDPAWQRRSFCWKVLQAENDTNDFLLAKHFWELEYPTTSEKTRSVGIAMATNVLDKFMSGPVANAVCGQSTVTPDLVLDGRVVILDWPVLVWREVGQFIQVIFKTCLQRAALRRVDPVNPTVIWADECQFFAVPEVDSMVQTVARQAKLINVMPTQNIPMLTSAFGGKEEEVSGWLANFNTQIFCANTDTTTNKYASALIGESRQVTFGGSTGNQQFDLFAEWAGKDQFHMNWNEQLMPEVRPEEFTRLTKGGKGGRVETIVYRSGHWQRWWFRQG